MPALSACRAPLAHVRPCPAHGRPAAARPRRAVRAAAGEKPAEVADEAKAAVSKDGTFYNDEKPLPKKEEMSPEFKKKLRDEYLGLGGSPDTPMRTNYFVVIGAVIAVLAVLSKLTGAI